MIKMLPGIVLAVLALFAQICIAGLGSIHHLAPIAFQDNDGIKLDFGHGQIYDKTAYNKAIVFMEELKTASSCQRLAASTLVQACHTLDDTTAIDVALAEVKEEYAAKMAACELSSVYNKAKDTVPKACKAFLPSKGACPKTGSGDGNSKMCYGHVSRAQVTSCVSALEERPQSWTSYSNALQNVHHACQASRLTIDKDHMLNQLRLALELFNAANEETKVNARQYQAEANHNLVRFQAAHAEVLVAIKNDWATVSDELIKHTWKSYLNMIGDIALHYGNLTDTFTRSSDAAIAKQDLALNKADDVANAIEANIAEAKALALQQSHISEVMSANNAKLLSDQALLQVRQEFTLSINEAIITAVGQLLQDFMQMKNDTSKIQNILKETSSLMPLLSSLTGYLHVALETAHAVLSLNVLTLACVVMNSAILRYVGGRLWRKGEMSAGGILRVAVVLHVALYIGHSSSSKDTSIGSFILFVLASRVAGLLVLGFYLVGAFTYNYLELFSNIFNRFSHRRRSNMSIHTRPTTGKDGLHRGKGRARSEEPREVPSWR